MNTEKIEISRSDLAEIIQQTSDTTVTKTLERLGLVKKTISFSEIRNTYGRALSEKAELSSSLKWIITGRRGKSGVEKSTDRAEFEKWLFSSRG